ncbi:MAG: hypothetical protein RLZZ217_1472, partial [Planctomycetota bacterium]
MERPDAFEVPTRVGVQLVLGREVGHRDEVDAVAEDAADRVELF